MKTWLIFLYLAPTVISVQLVVVSAEKHELQQNNSSNTGDSILWSIFRRIPLLFKVISDDNENNAKETLNPEEGLVEAGPRNEETADFQAESNTARREEESESIAIASQQTSLPENILLECLNATEPSPDGAATIKPTIITATTDSYKPQQCQPLSNPWASCNESTVEDEIKLAEALNQFAINFYLAAIQYEKSDSNLVFSPFSISMLLSNLLLGARGQTKEELENVLSYPKEFSCIHDAMSTFHKSKATIAASAIFAQPAFTGNDDFNKLSQKFYRSMIWNLTNDSVNNVNAINSWVRKSTQNKIKKLLDQVDSDVQMVLVNAVYFHSKWKTIFRSKDTIQEKFYRPGLPPSKVFMMSSKKYPLASFTDHTLQAKVGSLQLSHNMSLVIIMPRSLSQNLSDVEKRLSGDVFKSVMVKLDRISLRPTVVTIPKFKVDSSLDLMSIVGEMAYGIFFEANLCGISENEELAVSSAQHRAVMEINEEGVEAAAATAISLARTANFFEVQQPFIFVVVNEKRIPIFMGRINNPKA